MFRVLLQNNEGWRWVKEKPGTKPGFLIRIVNQQMRRSRRSPTA